MRTSALVRLTSALSVCAALVIAAPSAQALEPDPAAPVVVPDAVELWPGGTAIVDVLANDTNPGDPDGSQLALCRLPSSEDIFETLDAPVMIADAGGIFGNPNELMVGTGRAQLKTPATVEYYVCNYTHLTKATLTVTTRETKPVKVSKVPGKPGRLKVVNRNDTRIVVAWGTPRGEEMSGAKRVPGHGSRIIRVDDKRIDWLAFIGNDRNSGVAGQGSVRNIDLPEHRRKPSKSDAVGGGDVIPGIYGFLFGRLR